MTHVLAFSPYDFAVLELFASREQKTAAEWLSSFFDRKCNAPSDFAPEVQCTRPPLSSDTEDALLQAPTMTAGKDRHSISTRADVNAGAQDREGGAE